MIQWLRKLRCHKTARWDHEETVQILPHENQKKKTIMSIPLPRGKGAGLMWRYINTVYRR